MNDNPIGGNWGDDADRRTQSMKNTRLLELALSERWHVPQEIRGPIVERLKTIALAEDTSPREAVSAAKALLAASRLNLDTIGVAINAETHETLVKRVEELEKRINSP
jgi:hypothetical protein